MGASEALGGVERGLAGALGRIALRPAADDLALAGVTGLFLPLGVPWSAVEAVGAADPCALADAVGWRGRDAESLRRPAETVAARLGAARGADAAWRAALFAAEPRNAAQLARFEDARREAADAHLSSRLAFLPAHLRRRFAPVRFTIAGRARVEARHAARLADPAHAFPLPAFTPTVSATAARGEGGAFWMRWAGRAGGEDDIGWARVSFAGDRPTPGGPTLILAHGVGMETDHWRRMAAPQRRLLRAGWTIVEPEAPWHGRRRAYGAQAAEPLWAHGLLGFLDYFEAHVGELGALTAWARRRFGGPVALGGVSLGAQAAAKAIDAAAQWPAAARPDAAMLSTVTGALAAAAYDSAFLRRLGADRALTAAGWSADAIAAWAPLLDPSGPPGVAADRIVMILGDRDTVLPYAGGEALRGRWAPPSANVFTRRLGHFTTSLHLCRDGAPFDRLAAILDRPVRST